MCHVFEKGKTYKMYWLKFLLLFPFTDNVCIESMSVKITRRTIDKCNQNIDDLSKQIKRYGVISEFYNMV